MSDASLRSARIYSLALLVLGYVGLSFVWGHQQRLSTLAEARRAMAAVLAASPGTNSFPALGEIDFERREPGGNAVDVFVNRPGGGRWGTLGVRRYAEGDAGIPEAVETGTAVLQNLAAQVGIFDFGGLDPSVLYVQVEQQILGTQVTVPGVGLGFQGMQIIWVCVIASFGFLVILRDRVQHVLSDGGLAASERWLVVDGRSGIERLLSRIWLMAIMIVPIALSSGLILGVTKQIEADGATSSLAMDALMGVSALLLLMGNAWVALTATSRILELRKKRHAATEAARH